MDLKDKNLLITGIGGFVGLRTAEIALARGMKVKGLQRSQAKAENAVKLGAEVIIGDITDPEAAETACRDIDVVIHTAALATEGGKLEDFIKVNVEGSVNMAKAAKKAGVKTFVHISSVMVYGFTYPNGVTENEPFRKQDNPYCHTKIEAEKEVLKFNSPPDFGIIIIRPGDVYGPRSSQWVIKPLQLMYQRKFPLVNGGRGVMNHVYIDNLIDAIFLAIEKEPYGEAFNITDGQETSWKEYFTRLAAIASISNPFAVSLPAGMIKFLIRLNGIWETILGQKNTVLPDSVDFVTRPYAYSVEKAKNQLGYEPKIDLDTGMGYTQKWLNQIDIKQL